MGQPQFKRIVGQLALGCSALAAGILLGFWIGQTSLGKALPRLLAVGTVASFMTAVYLAVRHQRSKQEPTDRSAFILLCLFLCAAALSSSITAAAAWQLFPEDRIAGFIPYSDASDYYEQVLNWPARTFDVWNSRRPLNATLNVAEFHLGGSTLLGMIFFRVALASLAITAFIAALASVVNRSSALTAGFVLLIWTWPYASSMQSEINGITLSAAGYALMLAAMAQKRRAVAYMGLFALVLAYAFRPYNPLMPALIAFAVVLWMSPDWRKNIKAAVVAAVAATLLVVTAPNMVYLAYGHPDGTPNGNTGSLVLGVARGTDWKEASEYVASRAKGSTEKEMNVLMYEMAKKQVLNDPKPAMASVVKNGFRSLYALQTEFAFAWGIPRLVDPGDQGPRTLSGFGTAMLKRIEIMLRRIDIWIGLLISTSSILLLFLAREMPHAESSDPVAALKMLFFVTLVSFFSISPLLFIGDGWRVVATLYPGLALLAVGIPMGVGSLRAIGKTYGQTNDLQQERADIPKFARYVPIAIISFVLLVLPYPAVSRFLAGGARPSTEAMNIDIRDDERPHWTGFNRGVASPLDLRAWSNEQGHPEWAEFLSRHGRLVRQVRFEKGGYALILGDTGETPDRLQVPEDPVFHIRLIRE